MLANSIPPPLTPPHEGEWNSDPIGAAGAPAPTADIACVDCDVHPTVPGMKALLPYLDEHWQQVVVEREVNLESQSYPPNAPITADPTGAARTGARQPTWTRSQPRCSTAGARPRHPQLPLWRAARAQRGHGGCLRPRAQRLDRKRMARPRRAPARLDRGAAAECRAGGRGDRAAARRPALRAGAGAGDGRDAARPPALWPIYAAAERHGLPIGIHAGSAYRHPAHLARLADLLYRGLSRPSRSASRARSRA